jgi:DNA-binding transcriptional LysR family regulator
MKLAALDTLGAVLAHGSFTAAAGAVGLTPSAVSLQMKQLEEYFGRPLFDRSGRTALPTQFARELAGAAGSALAIIDSFRARSTLSVAGVLRVGAITSVQTSVLPYALRLLHERHPGLTVQLTLDVSGPLQAALTAGRLDAAVVVRPPHGGSTRLAWRDLARVPFVLVAPPGAQGSTATQLLRRHPWIQYERSLTGGRVAAQYVRRLVPQKRSAYEVASTDAIVAMVAEGLGVSVIPRPRAPLNRAYAFREVPLGSGAPFRQVSWLSRQSDIEDRRHAAMFDALQEAYRAGAAPAP